MANRNPGESSDPRDRARKRGRHDAGDSSDSNGPSRVSTPAPQTHTGNQSSRQGARHPEVAQGTMHAVPAQASTESGGSGASTSTIANPGAAAFSRLQELTRAAIDARGKHGADWMAALGQAPLQQVSPSPSGQSFDPRQGFLSADRTSGPNAPTTGRAVQSLARGQAQEPSSRDNTNNTTRGTQRSPRKKLKGENTEPNTMGRPRFGRPPPPPPSASSRTY